MSRKPRPSLVSRLRPSAPGTRHSLWISAILLLAALALIAIAATLRARQIEAATERHLLEAPSPAASEAEAQAMAEAFALPRLATTLAGLAAHLPSATPMAELARNRDGTLRLVIDAADPDELRALLAGDRWFADFHERGQEERAEGRIRVTLVEDGQ
jgi:hypothetical protein